MEDIEYLDYGGSPVPLEEFQQMFGPFYVHQPALSVYRVTCMYAVTGSNTFRLRIVDEGGAPVAGIPTVFGWPDGQSLGMTDGDGYSEFAMGGGAWYHPEEEMGPHVISLLADELADVVHGIGMVFGTNHNHFNVVMRYGSVDPISQAIAELEQAQVKNLEVEQHIATALALLEGYYGSPR